MKTLLPYINMYEKLVVYGRKNEKKCCDGA